MVSYEKDLFEVEENHIEFQDVCASLKSHPFLSPWKMFFKQTCKDKFVSEVSEFVIDANEIQDSVKDASSRKDDMLVDEPTDTFKSQLVSASIPINKKKVCRLKESLINAQDDTTIEGIKDFDVFLTTPSCEIPTLFALLSILELHDIALSLILNAFLHFIDEISIATATALVHHVISPLIFDSKKNTSRFLLTTILKFAEVYPKSIIDEILIPYCKKDTLEDLQSEVITQISKSNLPNEYVPYTIKNILEHASPVDNTFTLLQCLVERKVHLDGVLHDLCLKKLLGWSSTCHKNVKFTKLLTSILTAYGNKLNEEQILLCDEVVKTNKTILRKAAENLLKRLKQEH